MTSGRIDARDIGRLHHALYRNVFPLLQEYFYNDPERLRRLLGEYDAGAQSGFLRRLQSFRDAFGEDEILDEELPWEIQVYPKEELGAVLRNTFYTQP